MSGPESGVHKGRWNSDTHRAAVWGVCALTAELSSDGDTEPPEPGTVPSDAPGKHTELLLVWPPPVEDLKMSGQLYVLGVSVEHIYTDLSTPKGIRMWVMVKCPEKMEIREVTRPPDLSAWGHWKASWVWGAVVCSPVGGLQKPPH